jgi:hypothetical protein
MRGIDRKYEVRVLSGPYHWSLPVGFAYIIAWNVADWAIRLHQICRRLLRACNREFFILNGRIFNKGVCLTMSSLIQTKEVDNILILFSSEAWFHLSGYEYVNSLDGRNRSTETTCQSTECHYVKLRFLGWPLFFFFCDHKFTPMLRTCWHHFYHLFGFEGTFALFSARQSKRVLCVLTGCCWW